MPGPYNCTTTDLFNNQMKSQKAEVTNLHRTENAGADREVDTEGTGVKGLRHRALWRTHPGTLAFTARYMLKHCHFLQLAVINSHGEGHYSSFDILTTTGQPSKC